MADRFTKPHRDSDDESSSTSASRWTSFSQESNSGNSGDFDPVTTGKSIRLSNRRRGSDNDSTGTRSNQWAPADISSQDEGSELSESVATGKPIRVIKHRHGSDNDSSIGLAARHASENEESDIFKHIAAHKGRNRRTSTSADTEYSKDPSEAEDQALENQKKRKTTGHRPPRPELHPKARLTKLKPKFSKSKST